MATCLPDSSQLTSGVGAFWRPQPARCGHPEQGRTTAEKLQYRREIWTMPSGQISPWQLLVSRSTPSRSHRATSTPSTHISCFSSAQRLHSPTPPAPPSSHCSGGHMQHLGKATATKRRPLSVLVWKVKSDLSWPQRCALGLNPEQIGTDHRGAHKALVIRVKASL